MTAVAVRLGTDPIRTSGSTPFGPLNLDIVAVRDGAVVVSSINGGLGAADSDLSETLMRTMVDRL